MARQRDQIFACPQDSWVQGKAYSDSKKADRSCNVSGEGLSEEVTSERKQSKGGKHAGILVQMSWKKERPMQRP